MRETKYRAILKNEPILREVRGIDFLNLKVCISISGSKEWHEYKVLEQYTGLKDKNGVEIYEGDILEWEHKLGETYELQWAIDQARFVTVRKSGAGTWWPGTGEWEVIGNIHEEKK